MLKALKGGAIECLEFIFYRVCWFISIGIFVNWQTNRILALEIDFLFARFVSLNYFINKKHKNLIS